MRQQRRRMLLAEESLAGDMPETDEAAIRLMDTANRPASPAGYASKARNDCQRRVIDFIPLRKATLAAIVFAALASIVATGTLHVYAGALGLWLEPDDVAALRLDSPRNLSNWLASALLGLASLTAALVYSLRRHRADDYHGRYRVWLWAAIGCLALSLFETTDVAHVARGICRRGAAWCALDAGVVWPALVVTAWSLAALRMLVELRRCRLAVSALVACGMCLVASIVIRQGTMPDVVEAYRVPMERGAWLAGYVFVLAAFLAYARHVALDVVGSAAVPPRKRSKSAEARRAARGGAETDAKPALHLRTDLDPVQKSVPASAAQAHSTGADKNSAAPAKLSMSAGEAPRVGSKAERRRLRREARMAG
jgi:hypothetical protein